MSQPAGPPRPQDDDANHWLVPDTRDDIVVSHSSDF
jgi:hypothetical protein